MTGNKTYGLVLQDRDRHLLGEVGTMRLIDREQAKIVAGFSSTTRANTRLLALTRAGLLSRFFVGTIAGGRKAIYTLTARAASLVGAEYRIHRKRGQTLVGDLFVEHQMQINSVYLNLKYRPLPSPDAHLLRWSSFRQALSQSVRLVPDGYFEIESCDGIRCLFLEVDLETEAVRTWERKIREYLHLAISGEFERLFRRRRFRILVVTRTEKRLGKLRARVVRSTDKIFWFTTFESINREGFWSSIWQRPRGDQRHSLL